MATRRLLMVMVTDPPDQPPAQCHSARCDRDGYDETAMDIAEKDTASRDIASTLSLVLSEVDTVLHKSNKPQTILNVVLLGEATINIS